MDKGHGSCWLKIPSIAGLVEEALLHFDGERYILNAWVVMPNHVHTLFEPMNGTALESILASWKSFTANKANQTLGRSGQFWSKESFDRYIRDARHFRDVVDYIENNPVRAGLCKRPEDWPWSSAGDSKHP
jgi:REP element-mobilizing transposase RayT